MLILIMPPIQVVDTHRRVLDRARSGLLLSHDTAARLIWSVTR